MYVFAITAIFSIWAYVWLFIVLQDQFVDPTEAWITLGSMFVLLVLAYFADWFKSKQDGPKKPISNIEYSA